ncbi:hypothetical protein I4U23_030456 [Adineta vaga]|nr:hypothetical protein I4U23_030456 [Adineta vaga]
MNNNNDCLTEAFITIYKNSMWCLESIYKLIFKSFWQVLLLSTEDICEKSNLLFNKTRVTVRSMSNFNLNRTPSDQKSSSKTLGTINSHITVAPVDSSHCQNLSSMDNLPPTSNDLQELEKINSREQLADALCRRSYQPLMFTNRGMCCGHCRPMYFPTVPLFSQSSLHVPTIIPQHQQQIDRQEKGSPEKIPKLSDASETQSTPYSISPSIQSHRTNSREEDEPLITGTGFDNETNEQNLSIFSFPDHDTPLTQQSDDLINDEGQLILDAQVLVNDSIQNAQEKYQNILRMSIDRDLPNLTSGQLLLHPPFKPKRLIHLCPDGSIQVLSAIDDKISHDHHQQYHLNYSNSAITPQNHILTNESIPTQQTKLKNSILSLQKKRTLFKYDNSIEHSLTSKNMDNHLQTGFEENDPIVKIDLQLNDNISEINSENEENSLPEIFFKRIIAPERSIIPSTESPEKEFKYAKAVHLPHKTSRSRASRQKNVINIEQQSESK